MDIKKRNILILVVLSFVAFFFLVGGNVFAQNYIPLSPLPGIESISTEKPEGYFRGLIGIAIGVAGILAVILLMVYGLIYLMSTSEGKKSAAKSGMTNVIFGLLIIFLSWVTLFVINPDLVKIKFFDRFREASGAPASPSTPSSSTSYCYLSSNGQYNSSYSSQTACENAQQAEIDKIQEHINELNSVYDTQTTLGLTCFSCPNQPKDFCFYQYTGTTVNDRTLRGPYLDSAVCIAELNKVKETLSQDISNLELQKNSISPCQSIPACP